MICPVCNNEEATVRPLFGVLPGVLCRDRRSQNKLPDSSVEMVGASVQGERTEFAKSIVQPFNRYGEFSEEYYQANGTKGVSVTEAQIKNRKKIWDKALSENLDISQTK